MKYNIGDVVTLNGNGGEWFTIVGILTSKATKFDPDYIVTPSNILSPSLKYIPECVIKENIDVLTPESYALNHSLYKEMINTLEDYKKQRFVESGKDVKTIFIDFDELLDLYNKI